jgi:hypothetical protein
MKIHDVLWFCGRSNVGIVRVEDEWDGIKYYIGAPPYIEHSPNSEDYDREWIADWGSTFPKEVGDILFGEDGLRNGTAVQLPQNKEQAEMMIKVASYFLEQV